MYGVHKEAIQLFNCCTCIHGLQREILRLLQCQELALCHLAIFLMTSTLSNTYMGFIMLARLGFHGYPLLNDGECFVAIRQGMLAQNHRFS